VHPGEAEPPVEPPLEPPVEPPLEPVADTERENEVAGLLRRPEALRCVYQPVVDLHTGECAGYEALTRVADWPARSPQPWFSAAARSGLAGQLEAAALANAFRGRADLSAEQFLAVNVAAAHLEEEVVLAVLRDQPDLAGLVVELAFADSSSEFVPGSATAALRVAGLRIACDVSDAGLEDLDRLHRVRPDLVKLDAHLVKGAFDDPVRDRLIRLVVSMAEGMGAVVQAEGIESLDDARHMQVLGVRLAQGWLFGRARPSFLPPAAEVSTWLRASWEETVARTRTGRLATPLAAEADGWDAELDEEGRLITLGTPGGDRMAASRLLRLRAAQDLRSAAVRVLASDAERRAHGIVIVTDDKGRFVGLTDVDSVMREVLAEGR
jgi:EAL domain-containing protein (putative c-di-GMP-specific phosphodiesterase class I)